MGSRSCVPLGLQTPQPLLAKLLEVVNPSGSPPSTLQLQKQAISHEVIVLTSGSEQKTTLQNYVHSVKIPAWALKQEADLCSLDGVLRS